MQYLKKKAIEFFNSASKGERFEIEEKGGVHTHFNCKRG
jgi:hypothetical protein